MPGGLLKIPTPILRSYPESPLRPDHRELALLLAEPPVAVVVVGVAAVGPAPAVEGGHKPAIARDGHIVSQQPYNL